MNAQFQEFLNEGQSDNFLKPENVKKVLLQRWIPLKQTGVPPRVFHAWKEAGIMLGFGQSEDKERERTMLTVADYVWTMIVKTLRSFGMGYKEILVVQNQLFISKTHEEYATDQANLLIITDPIERAIFIRNTIDALAERDYVPSLEMGGALGQYIILIVHAYALIKLHILEDGSIIPIVNSKHVFEHQKKEAWKPYISINLNQILFDLLLEPTQTKQLLNSELLTDVESEILEMMRSKSIRKLEIRFNDKGGPMMMQWTEEQQVTHEQYELFIKNMKLRPYQEIKIKSNDNTKSAYVEKVYKRKLNG